jgi:hypothetical protein
VSSLEEADHEAATVAVASRVTLPDIEGAITARFDLKPDHLFGALGAWSVDDDRDGSPPTYEVVESLKCFSVCLLVMSNGFVVSGKSAPALPANFDADLGRKLAYEDCIRQLWPLMGFSLRDRLAAARA